MSRRMLYLLAAILVAAPIGLLVVLSVLSRRPADLGPVDGRLAACPETPNCVSSQSDATADPGHHVQPLAFTGEGGAAFARLVQVLEAQPRTEIISRRHGYLHAEATSLLFRFVDDLEFLLDPGAGVIHVRSASRVGRSDLGANRRRVGTIRRALGAP